MRKTPTQVAIILGVSNKTVLNRANKIGLKMRGRRFLFSDEEIEQLRDVEHDQRAIPLTVNQKHEIVRLFLQGGNNSYVSLAERTGCKPSQILSVMKNNIQENFFVIKSKL